MGKLLRGGQWAELDSGRDPYCSGSAPSPTRPRHKATVAPGGQRLGKRGSGAGDVQ